MEVTAHGLEHLPLGTRSVLVPNHQSYADVVALFHVLPEAPVFLAKKELRRIPFFGAAMETGGHVFVDRQNRGRALEAMTEAAKGLRDGCPLVIFPEGTRRTGQALRPFKKGAFHLARGAHVPIVPIGIRGSLEAWPTGKSAPTGGGHVSIHVGEPFSAERVASGDLDELIAQVRAEVGRLAGLPLE
jgi:1-acyl-sn-glycerol-3-phosphate acyltransferase